MSIQILRGPASTTDNLVLPEGQPYVDIESNPPKLKIGDGTTGLNDLPYIGASAAKTASGYFTPRLVSDGGVDPTVQYTEGQTGYYYRIGALVFTNFDMKGRITNAGTGYAAIGGFPFVGDAQGFSFGITTFSLPVCSELISSDVVGYIIRFVPSLGIARINNANGKNPVKFMVSGTYNFEVRGSIFYIANDGNSYQ